MRRMLFCVTGVVACLVVTASAQWFRIRTPGVPRLVSGAPNLTAPAPRAADGHPDLSGIWVADNPLPCPPLLRDGNDCLEKMPLSKEAYNIAATLPGGLPYQPWAAMLAKQRAAENAKDDPHVRCLPSNPPRNWALPHYQKIIQIPGLVAMLSEFNASYRQIFTEAGRCRSTRNRRGPATRSDAGSETRSSSTRWACATISGST
jgi:hypothetical protein